MCGINGIYAYAPSASLPARGELLRTRDRMAARGPDGFGEWWTSDRRLALGHRRLSILDLSDRASQPMQTEDGSISITFNGEIYNYPQLKAELLALGRVFRTNSDTEILLHLYELEGQAMVTRLRGMFAFAIWDGAKRGLFLARDPYGIKPLYTASDGWTFRFASQVKALLAGGAISRDPEPAGVVGFHLWGSVPDPFTLFRDIRPLPAGHTQWIDGAGPAIPVAYASIAGELSDAVVVRASADEVVDRVRTSVLESVRAHLLSDVEVGIFLSAGVDSGALLGLMRDAGHDRIRAITLAFDEFRGTPEDEEPMAAQTARLYGAEHVVSRVSAADFQECLPRILVDMDQPSIDGVNSWFAAKAAKEAGIKVAISGLGGDELLAGYPSFTQVPRWAGLLGVPSSIPGLGKALRLMGAALGVFHGRPKALGALEFGGSYAGAYFLRRGLFLPFEVRTQVDPELLAVGLRRLRLIPRLTEQALHPMPRAPLSKVAALEASWYMRHQLLRDTDWAGMAHGVEVRTPLVDFQLLKELAPIIPRFKNQLGKIAMAKAPTTPLPDSIIARDRTGFVVPTGRWGTSPHAGVAVESKGQASRVWAQQVLSMATVNEVGPVSLPLGA